MLSKKVCQHCYTASYRQNPYLFDSHWKMGTVECATVDKIGIIDVMYIDITKDAPDTCPYILEHTVHAQ